MGLASLEFTIPGLPFHNKRHRSAVKNGRVIQYDPSYNKNGKATVREWAEKSLSNKDKIPFEEGPVALFIYSYFPLPKSHYRKKNPRPASPHVSKPDVDNVAKLYMDAMTGVIWKDDSQVALLQVAKVRCAQDELPRVRIVVKPIEREDAA